VEARLISAINLLTLKKRYAFLRASRGGLTRARGEWLGTLSRQSRYQPVHPRGIFLPAQFVM
jgi:hypothetical protein